MAVSVGPVIKPSALHPSIAYESGDPPIGERTKRYLTFSPFRRREGSEKKSSWTPTLFRLGPCIGLVALGLTVLFIVASFAVLKASAGDRVSAWQYQPSVYLAIFTALSNKALAFALVQGTAISFWLHLVKGTTLSQVHRDWAYGLHVSKALLAGRHFNALALASILCTFVAIDGPLLQRASSVRTEVVSEPISIEIAVSPEIPSYSTGKTTAFKGFPQGQGVEAIRPFTDVVSDQLAGRPITLDAIGCPGICAANITAPALAIDYCESTYDWIDYLAPLSNKTLKAAQGQSFFLLSRQVFSVEFFNLNGTAETFIAQTQAPDDSIVQSCRGFRNTTRCYMRSAIGHYTVLISDGAVSFPKPPGHVEIIAMANNTALTEKTIQQHGLKYHSINGHVTRTTLSGVAFWAFIALGAQEYLYSPQRTNSTAWHNITEAFYPEIGLLGNWHQTNFRAIVSGQDCAPSWGNPMENVLAGLNEFMFRAGVWLGRTYNESYLLSQMDPGLVVRYNTTATPQVPASYFQSDFRYFAGAASIELLAVLIVMYTFYGWWRLGRDVSLSPLEIAKAFEAPLLQEAGESNTAGEIIAVEGSRTVRYGVATTEDSAQIGQTVGAMRSILLIGDGKETHALE